jgi:hypothetical protein
VILAGLGPPFDALALMAFALFVFIAVASGIRSWRIRRQFDTQNSIGSLQRLHWNEFENLIGRVPEGDVCLERVGSRNFSDTLLAPTARSHRSLWAMS